jgi:GNAT superfamily N-acetyltransferase
VAGASAKSRAISISAISPDDAGKVTHLIAQRWRAAHDERLHLMHRAAPVVETGWVARDGEGAVIGAIVEPPDGSADIALGSWVGVLGVSGLLYRKAAAAWASSGKLAHWVTLAADDALGAELLDLGFGHQQAHGVAAVDSLPREGSAGVLRKLSPADAAELTELVPLVSRHQSEAPVFAPRLDAFYQQLPSSIGAFLEDPAAVAWGYSATARSPLDGFLLAELRSGVVEISLMGIRCGSRGEGIGSALLSAATTFSRERGTAWLLTDWRTTNPESSRFWLSMGFAPVAYRWCRVIDEAPER